MKEIDLSKYEGKFSWDSSLLINILKDANLTADNVLFDDIDKEGRFLCKHNAKITKENKESGGYIFFYSKELNWSFCNNSVKGGIFFTDSRPLIIYKR